MELITDLWNTRNLDPPPINSSKSNVKEIDIKFLDTVLKDAVDFYENQKHLCTEAALLSRIIYRSKMKFRSSKDFKALGKLSRALKTYLQIEISKVLKVFSESVPSYYQQNKTYLPTKHMMDFVLVRLQGLGKLLVRTLETCKIIADLFQQRLRLGHFWKMIIIIYGMVARIFVISKGIMKYTCTLYSNLLPYTSKLNNSGKQWLPDGYVLPDSLNEWLQIDWMDLESTIIEIADEPEISFFNLIEDSDDDIEFCDEYIFVNDDSSLCELTEPLNDNVEQHKDAIEITDGENVDIGEEINLEHSISNNEKNSKSILNTQNGFNDNIDVGEVINLIDITTPKSQLQVNRKRKRGKNVPSRIIENDEIINLNDIPKPRLQIKAKRKLQVNPQSKTPKTTGTREVIILSDIETASTQKTKKKKRKPAKKIESETIETRSSVEWQSPNKKGKTKAHNFKVKKQKICENKIVPINSQNPPNQKKKTTKKKKKNRKNVIQGTSKISNVKGPTVPLNTKKTLSMLNKTKLSNSRKRRNQKKKHFS